ncbi:type II toxin-antitoxin system HipA family toxin [Cytophagaceae bacterium SJW1-29]|uniref:Type II toxin-antitoxin system HipA family toxin n=1 Tax=Salmonirosea aquatica TaxID=2654236 RepID=A0A7C9BR57_9BACT|nr:type II toxin-antitoxin system HipA family toxin [Cytophagaceae bacterium SJW1-29]
MMNKCLYCYEPLTAPELDYHFPCSQKFFGSTNPPILPLEKAELQKKARELVIRSIAVTGVQPKLSLDIEKTGTQSSRFTVVGLWGNFILKPPTEQFAFLPENEDLTMKMAAEGGIATAEHTLIRLNSGELAYLTRRFDRREGQKIHMEDLCQLTETLTEHKYRGSLEKIGRAVRAFTTNKGLEALKLFELTVFCFITGNADMHLKNFTLVRPQNGDIALSPAYDLLSTKLALPEDKEESALTINGKKNRLSRTDFDALARHLGISPKSVERIYDRFGKKKIIWERLIQQSFLPPELQGTYQSLLIERLDRIGV